MRKLDFPNVVPESYVDTNLMQSLLKGTVNHQMGCTKVISSLNNALSDRFAIGVIDLDREQHRMTGYLGQCDIVAETRHMGGRKKNPVAEERQEHLHGRGRADAAALAH